MMAELHNSKGLVNMFFLAIETTYRQILQIEMIG